MFIERRCRSLLAVQWPGFLGTVFVYVFWGSWLPRFARIGPHQQSKCVSKADAIVQCNSTNMLEIRNDVPGSLHTLDVVWLESLWYKVHCTCIVDVYIWLVFRGSPVFELHLTFLSIPRVSKWLERFQSAITAMKTHALVSFPRGTKQQALKICVHAQSHSPLFWRYVT